MIKRYWYIVWRRRFNQTRHWKVIDIDPADWLVAELPRHTGDAGCPIIDNQFEITAEQYNRLESLQ